VHELADALPAGAKLLGDKAYISASDATAILTASGVRLVAQARANMQPLDWWDDFDLRDYRHTIETVNSQLEKMAIERIYARTNPGFSIKVHAAIVALALTNAD
jgi:hypothetical protein